ncbi:MAG: ATP-binding protein [Candidatus Dormiibacterota bacterium]
MTERVVKELATFELPSLPGKEREALALVAAAVSASGLLPDQLERLKTAVAEATMNAIEHGNHDQSDLPVEVTVFEEPGAVVVSISDRGALTTARGTAVEPDLDKKLSGLQTPRGWGLFLIRHMVDAVDEVSDGDRHTVRLTVHPGVPPAYPRSQR